MGVCKIGSHSVLYREVIRYHLCGCVCVFKRGENGVISKVKLLFDPNIQRLNQFVHGLWLGHW